MKKYVIAFILLQIYQACFGQSLTVFDVDTSAFPVMKAKFYAFDARDSLIKDLTTADFQVTENGVPRTVLSVSCPVSTSIPISSVLVMDVSGSMCGKGLNIAKAAANAWIDLLPLGKSECAITSFSDKNYINQDFTTDKIKLVNGINSLSCKNGTNYNAAMIDPKAGGILIAKTGKYKKVIVFLSDGGPNFEPNTAQIISQANANNIIIYCVTIAMPAPQCMKDFANQTSGLCFENIKTEEEAEKCYRKILMTEQSSNPCQIEWQSGVQCSSSQITAVIKLLRNNSEDTVVYTTPSSAIASLEVTPSGVYFKNIPHGTQRDTTITVKAINSAFTVTNITSSNPLFSIAPTSFSLNAGDSIKLTVSYTPLDSNNTFSTFSFISNQCQATFYATAGFSHQYVKTLKLTFPNGGESFVVGSDTVITWTGVLSTDTVKLEYSIDSGKTWNLLTTEATGLSWTWRNIPHPASFQCLARVTTKIISSGYYNEMVLIPAGTFQMGNTGKNPGQADEKPIHNVTISNDFLMSKYEVTQKLYKENIGANRSFFKGDSLPVENVTWYEAVEFCNKLSDKEGLKECYSGTGNNIICNWSASGYRLPTEAEWEYACKAGSTTDIYIGDLFYANCSPLDSNLDKIGWYCGNAGNKTHPVGEKEPNLFGLYDMSGNVWEWCWDWFDAYPSGTIIDPKGPDTDSGRTIRGDCYLDGSMGFDCGPSADRGFEPPDFIGFNNLGFRILRTFYDLFQSDQSDSLWSIVMPVAASQDIDMGIVIVNDVKDSLVSGFVRNIGTWKFRVDSIYFRGADASAFGLVSGIPRYIVASGGSHLAEFHFSPSRVGIHTAEIVIITQTDTLIQNIRGEGVQPQLAVLADYIDFGKVIIGSQKDTLQTVTIKNIGSFPLLITNTKHNKPNDVDFTTLAGGGTFTLQTGDTCKMDLRFKPSDIGRTSGTLEFYYNGLGSPAIVQLYGEGIKPEIKLWLPDTIGRIGDTKFNIPLRAKIIDNGSEIISVSSPSFRAEIQFKYNAFLPDEPQENVTGDTIDKDMRILLIENKNINVSKNDIVLANIRGTVLLGDSVAPLMIKSFSWENPAIETITEDGSLRIFACALPIRKVQLFTPASMSIFPNPAADEFIIELSLSEKGKMRLELINSAGMVVKQIMIETENVGSSEMKISIGELSSGLYLIKLQTPTVISTKNILIYK